MRRNVGWNNIQWVFLVELPQCLIISNDFFTFYFGWNNIFSLFRTEFYYVHHENSKIFCHSYIWNACSFCHIQMLWAITITTWFWTSSFILLVSFYSVYRHKNDKFMESYFLRSWFFSIILHVCIFKVQSVYNLWFYNNLICIFFSFAHTHKFKKLC